MVPLSWILSKVIIPCYAAIKHLRLLFKEEFFLNKHILADLTARIMYKLIWVERVELNTDLKSLFTKQFDQKCYFIQHKVFEKIVTVYYNIVAQLYQILTVLLNVLMD